MDTCPDKWVILEFITKNKSFKKILSSWYGGYLGTSSWKISNAISKISEIENEYEFITETGSIYKCHKMSYGMSPLANSILDDLIIQAKMKDIEIELIEESSLVMKLKECN